MRSDSTSAEVLYSAPRSPKRLGANFPNCRYASRSTIYVISTNRVKVANLVIITRTIKNTYLIIYYYYKKFDCLKINYLDKNKE